MLFSDRPEVRNPGRLLHPLTFDMLRVPHRSIPGNRLPAHPLYLAGHMERMGKGTVDMIRQCADGFFTTIRRPAAERPEPGRVTTRDGENAGRNRAGVQVARPGVQVGVQVGVQAGGQVGESASADPARMARDSSATSGAGRPEHPETQDDKGPNTLGRRAAEAATTKGREGRRSGGQVGGPSGAPGGPSGGPSLTGLEGLRDAGSSCRRTGFQPGTPDRFGLFEPWAALSTAASAPPRRTIAGADRSRPPEQFPAEVPIDRPGWSRVGTRHSCRDTGMIRANASEATSPVSDRQRQRRFPGTRQPRPGRGPLEDPAR